jgi:Fe2+ or Zn2+ uptake regulation protein/O6-methylguanine-DNA--protein-cysteine methyltransferase
VSCDRAHVDRVLHAHGLRSTLQRRVILGVVQDAGEAHLSAEEVHARALSSLPNLGRGTVYATLAELSALGALSAVGLPEPVRYEANTRPHGHFRCRLCARLFDLHEENVELGDLGERFSVERITVRAEGECADCSDYRAGLLGGISAISGCAAPPWAEQLEQPGFACARASGPLGEVVLAATPSGLVRVAFEMHADFERLRARSRSGSGARAARTHLSSARTELARFIAGESEAIRCDVDLDALGDGSRALSPTQAIPWDSHRSFLDLGLEMSSFEIGTWMGANPMPIVFPCHRVSRGREVPQDYVAGGDQRDWLEALERERSARA